MSVLVRLPTTAPSTPCWHPVAAAAALLLAGACAHAQTAPPALGATPGAKALPIIVQARELYGRPDLETIAEGDAELQQGPTTLWADRLEYDIPRGVAKARGNVRILREGNRFAGPELELQLDTYEGYFLQPSYHFALTQAGGQAQRVDFLGRDRLAATDATYSSCTPDDAGEYAWLLQADNVRFDFENNEGVAQGGVLRFMGVPVLAAPYLSFPLSDARKSGWLPPSLDLDNKSGLSLAVPYYWNIAPNRDATITPTIMTRRGLAASTQFRYLEPGYSGQVDYHLLPNDKVANRSRSALAFNHLGVLPYEGNYRLRVTRVSDDEYWKDFERNIASLTPRLLPTDAQAAWWHGDWQFYARAQRWQVLQDLTAPITAPYARAPQVGVRRDYGLGAGLQLALEAEVNRFVLDDDLVSGRPEGTRVHALGSLSWPLVSNPGWFLTPRLTFNAASYRIENTLTASRRTASRFIPTVSVDTGWTFERPTEWFGRKFTQTLEPRLVYVHTPYRNQDDLPNFDSAPKDQNFSTAFDANPFSGIDRVADAHHVTAGAYTRLLDEATGLEALKLGIAQRYLLRDQRITPEGVPFTQRMGDVLLLGSTGAIPNWGLQASVQYNPDIRRTVRSTLSARYAPGPFRTVSASYSLTRKASEQLDVGWQWPLYRAQPAAAATQGSGNTCSGTLYGVGRLNYSLRDRRMTDSLLGLEYDAGCWIGRVVAVRRSTSQQEATTRLMFQIEFVGLSRLGSNPLTVLKDNIPGYQLLRDDGSQR